jgi:hypothetical protein
MCNAHNHPNGCQCGFGPPYPHIEVSIRKLLNEGDRKSPMVAELGLSFPISKANFFHLVDNAGKDSLLATAVEVLQPLADELFGKGNIKVIPADIKKGSIVIDVALVTVGAAYVFFKDYEALKKGVEAFVKDIGYVSRKLLQIIKRKYSNEERKALRKTIRDRKSKEQVSKESKPPDQ